MSEADTVYGWCDIENCPVCTDIYGRPEKPKAAPLDDVGNDSGDTEKNEVK